jgi:hypothetical protein
VDPSIVDMLLRTVVENRVRPQDQNINATGHRIRVSIG